MCGGWHAWQGGMGSRGACGVEGACVAGGMHGRGHAWWGGMHGKGACVVGECAWQGACVTQGHAWQERRPLQRAVRILLECILVFLEHRQSIIVGVASCPEITS